jgi:hypothetical protein
VSFTPAPLPPRIVAPTITPAVVEAPADLRARIAATFAPQYAELERQQALAVQATNSDLANRGLAESGVAVGAVGQVNEAAMRQRGVLAGQQAGVELAAEQEVRLANAANVQQARLAQAQINAQVESENARNILQGNLANAEGYLRALGINAEQASAFRGQLLGYMTEQQKIAISQSQLQLDFLATIFSAQLRSYDVGRTLASEEGRATAANANALTIAQMGQPAPTTFGPTAPGFDMSGRTTAVAGGTAAPANPLAIPSKIMNAASPLTNFSTGGQIVVGTGLGPNEAVKGTFGQFLGTPTGKSMFGA